MKRLTFPSPQWGKKCILATLGGVLLFLAYPPFNLFFLAWGAFVPLLFALRSTSKREGYIIGVIFGTTAVFGGFNWIQIWAQKVIAIPFPLSYLLAFGYAFTIAQLFGAIALTYKWLTDVKVINTIFLFPITFLSLFSICPMLFYFKLGDSQSYFLTAIQGIDIFGVWGLDFVILLSNALLFEILSAPKKGTKHLGRFLASGLILLWFGYGAITLQQWQNKISAWDQVNVGLVQTNRMAQLKTPEPEPGYSRTFPLEMDLSQRLKKESPDFIIWPEGNFFGYTFWKPVENAFNTHVKQLNIPIIFHDTTVALQDGIPHYYNSALYINSSGNLQNKYHKIKRVPFGEYIPLTEDFPFLKAILGSYVSNLSAGKEHEIFDLNPLKLVPKLCYESLFPEFVAKSVGMDGKGKVLVVQSQDGWFGKSSQPEQHLTATTLRAVENRVPLIHSINNGSSAITLPTGEYVFKSPFYEQGQWVIPMPFDKESGGSFYSQHPFIFIYFIQGLMLSLVLFKVFYRRIQNAA